jgi:hypothetical protein
LLKSARHWLWRDVQVIPNEWLATRLLRARTGPTFRLDADSIIDGVADPPLAAKFP